MKGVDISKMSGVSNKAVVHQKDKAVEGQVRNNAGGYVFAITEEKRLERFLVLGADTNSIYLNKQKSALQNCTNIVSMMKKTDLAHKAVDMAVKYSDEGRVINNDNALLVLALALTHGDASVKAHAELGLSKVARIGTHILHMTDFINQLRGWGHGIRRVISNWYLDQSPEDLAFQILKYKSRDGWSHRDVLRMAHPKAKSDEMNAVLRYIAKGEVTASAVPIIKHYEDLMKEPSIAKAVSMIEKNRFPREMIPTDMLNERAIWEALLVNMPMTAMIRNLNKLTNTGVLSKGDYLNMVVNRLKDEAYIQKSRIHPLSVLIALRTYNSGQGERGSQTWVPNRKVSEALEDAFYLSFKNVTPTGKRFMIGLDISGSMGGARAGNTSLTAREVSLAFSMATIRVEEDVRTFVFDADYGVARSGIREVKFDKNSRLESVVTACGTWRGGSTDCSLPMIHAREKNIPVDVFLIFTDNETWAGQMHPFEALKKYRAATGINAKLIVAATSSTGFSIADPSDAGMLDIVGFDPSYPQLIDSFVTEF